MKLEKAQNQLKSAKNVCWGGGVKPTGRYMVQTNYFSKKKKNKKKSKKNLRGGIKFINLQSKKVKNEALSFIFISLAVKYADIVVNNVVVIVQSWLFMVCHCVELGRRLYFLLC